MTGAKQLLVVSRNIDLCERLRSHYASPDYEIQITTNEDEAISIATSQPPDVLIVDTVSAIDGQMILQEIKFRGIPIVFVIQKMIEAVKLGMPNRSDSYIYPPVDFEKLTFRLQKAFEYTKIRREGKIVRTFVVSSDVEMIEMLRGTLEANRIEVKSISSGEAVMPILLELGLMQQPDVILVDVPLPDLEIHEFCRILRTHVRTLYIPIILLVDEQNILLRYMDDLFLSTDAYVTKPIQLKELMYYIRHAVRYWYL